MKITHEMGVALPDTTITTGDPVFLDVRKPPFTLHGFCEPFRRVPADVAEKTSEKVVRIAPMGAGGRVRFKTDSDYIIVHAKLGYREMALLMSQLSCQSFDMYFYEDGEQKFAGVFVPSQGDDKDYIECRLRFDGKMHDVIINFPILSCVEELCVGLRLGSNIEAPSQYKHKTPIVFYGSSIVHGVGAGRPGMAYPLIISRLFDTDVLNLGFGAAAKAEDAIIDYMKTLDMSVFVYDYDHNAPSQEYLRQTHYKGYRRIRDARPDLPIIMASKPDYWASPESNEVRRRIIISTYERAKSEGDTLVHFVDGKNMYDADMRNEFTSDNCHPNDAGYVAMARAFAKEIGKYICIK